MKRGRGAHRDAPAVDRPDGVPSDAGAAAARARVAHMLEQMTRVELQVVVVSMPDETRRAAEDRARDAAIVAGRTALLREAVQAAREATIRLFARGGYSGTWAVTDRSISVANASDRVAAAAAFEEAAMAAVVEDLVDDETVHILRSTSDELAHFTGMPIPGSLSAVASPAVGAIRSPIQVAIVVAVVIVCAIVGFGVASVSGLVAVFLAIGIIGAVARRSSTPIL
jgi:hypothetical protein